MLFVTLCLCTYKSWKCSNFLVWDDRHIAWAICHINIHSSNWHTIIKFSKQSKWVLILQGAYFMECYLMSSTYARARDILRNWTTCRPALSGSTRAQKTPLSESRPTTSTWTLRPTFTVCSSTWSLSIWLYWLVAKIEYNACNSTLAIS